MSRTGLLPSPAGIRMMSVVSGTVWMAVTKVFRTGQSETQVAAELLT